MGSNRDPFYGAPVVLIVLATRDYGNLCLLTVPCRVTDTTHMSQGIASCWIHRAKEEFESPEGKQILKDLGITGDYEGNGH